MLDNRLNRDMFKRKYRDMSKFVIACTPLVFFPPVAAEFNLTSHSE